MFSTISFVQDLKCGDKKLSITGECYQRDVSANSVRCAGGGCDQSGATQITFYLTTKMFVQLETFRATLTVMRNSESQSINYG